MGILLIVEVLDWAPLTLTQREHKTLIVFAEDARDGFPGQLDQYGNEKRVIWRSVVSPDTLRRARVSRTQMYSVIASLIDQECLQRVVKGGGGHVAKYRIPALAPVENLGLRPGSRDAGTEGCVPVPGQLRPGSGTAASLEPGPLAFSAFTTPQLPNGSAVNSSVEGTTAASGPDLHQSANGERNRQLDDLAEWMRQHPESEMTP